MTGETGTGTPQAAATEWVEAVMDGGDLARAWELTDPTLRLVLAQDWAWNHRHDLAAAATAAPTAGTGGVDDDRWDDLTRGLAAFPPEHDLWGRFAAETVATWQQIWKGFSSRTWRVSDQPEVLGLDLEMVTFVEMSTDGSGAHPAANPHTYPFARRFAMVHSDSRWLVASINGDQLFQPGWPPTLGRHAG